MFTPRRPPSSGNVKVFWKFNFFSFSLSSNYGKNVLNVLSPEMEFKIKEVLIDFSN